MSGVGDVGCSDQWQLGLDEKFAAGLHVRALEADDERNWKLDGFYRIDDSLSDDVAFHDAAENIDEDRFHALVGNQNFKGLGDLLLGGAAADIEEVRRLAPVVLDDVHRGHGQAGTIHEAGDISIEPDVAQIRFRGLDLAGVFLLDIAVVPNLGVAEERVVVKIEFGIQREHVAAFGNDERVHLDHRAVAADEKLVEIRKKFAGETHLAGRHAKKFCQLAGLKRKQTVKRIHRHPDNFLGAVLGHGFDVDPALGARDNHRCGNRAVDENGEVELAVDLNGL